MASIEKRGGSYRITVSAGYDIYGNQIRQRETWTPPAGMSESKAEKEARHVAALFEEQVRTGQYATGGNTKLQDFMQIYRDDYLVPMKRKNTLAKFDRDEKRISAALGHMKLKDIRPMHITKFAANLQEPGIRNGGGTLALSSVHTILGTLSAVLGKAVRWGYITSNPCAQAEKPPQPDTEAEVLEEADARRMLEALRFEPIKWRAFVICDLVSGMRRAELLGLQWEDIDMDKHMVYIRHTWNYTAGVGCYMDRVKSSRSKRPIHLASAFFDILVPYKAWQDRQRELLGDAWAGDPDDNRVFTSDDGAPIFPTSPTKWMRGFIRRSGLPHATIHTLRHTYASMMIEDGVSVVAVANQLGHAKTSTTENIYAHVLAAEREKAAQTMERFDDVVTPPQKKQA